MKTEEIKNLILSGQSILMSDNTEDMNFTELFYSEIIKEFVVALNGKWMLTSKSFKIALNRFNKYIDKYSLTNEEILTN